MKRQKSKEKKEGGEEAEIEGIKRRKKGRR